MQLMQFYNALKRSPNPVDSDGEPIGFDWEDDGEDGLALRISFENCDSVLVFTTDRITQEGNDIIVTVGARDYKFTV